MPDDTVSPATDVPYATLESSEPVIYGVWASQREEWYVLDTGEVFNTPYPSVAAAQIQHVKFRMIAADYIVREFPPLEDGAIFRS